MKSSIKPFKKKKKKFSAKILILILLIGAGLYFFALKSQAPLSISWDKQCKTFKLIARQKANIKIRSQSLNSYIYDQTISAGDEIQFGDSKGIELELIPANSAILIYNEKELNLNKLTKTSENTLAFKCS